MNLEKEEFIQRAQEKYPNSDIDFSDAYDKIFGTLTSLVTKTNERIYVPKIGVLYRKEILNKSRWMDDVVTTLSEPRYKIAISAKPFKVKEGGSNYDSSYNDREDR